MTWVLPPHKHGCAECHSLNVAYTSPPMKGYNPLQMKLLPLFPLSFPFIVLDSKKIKLDILRKQNLKDAQHRHMTFKQNMDLKLVGGLCKIKMNRMHS